MKEIIVICCCMFVGVGIVEVCGLCQAIRDVQQHDRESEEYMTAYCDSLKPDFLLSLQ